MKFVREFARSSDGYTIGAGLERIGVATLQPARLALWHGARTAGETGVEPVNGYVAFALLELALMPDFSAASFTSLARLGEMQRVQYLGEQFERFLATLHPLGNRYAFSLRYYYFKAPTGEGRIRIFFIARHLGATADEASRGIVQLGELFRGGFPREYPLIDRSGDAALAQAALSLEGARSIAEVLKSEQFVPAQHDSALCGFPFFYYPVPFRPAPNDMLDSCRTLIALGGNRSAIVDITLVPAEPLTPAERRDLLAWNTTAEKWSHDQRRTFEGLFAHRRVVEIAADRGAVHAQQAYTELLQRYGSEGGVYFLCALRVVWGADEPPRAIASELAARALAAGSSTSVRVLRGDETFTRALNATRFCFVTPAVCDERWCHPGAPETLRRLHRLTDCQELSGLFRLPVAGPNGCPGVGMRSSRETYYLRALLPTPEESWAKESSAHGLVVPIGWTLTESQVQDFRLGGTASQHALLAGQTNSGKSTLLHTLILGLCAKYSPAELQLLLVDMKEGGVEFSVYRHLPHARVVAMASDRDFGISVLRSAVSEMAARGLLFPQGVSKFERYREVVGALPRILVVVDEFQLLFEASVAGEALAAEANQLLDRIAATGRAYGIHFLLATQSLVAETGTFLTTRTQSQCALRIALKMNTERDAAHILLHHPADALRLKTGEAVYEDNVANPEGNVAFKVAYADNDATYAALREAFLQQFETLLRSHAEFIPDGARSPLVFDGRGAADPMSNEAIARLAATGPPLSPPVPLQLYVGAALDAKSRHLAWQLRRQASANLVVCGSDEATAQSVVLAVCWNLVLLRPPWACRLDVLDLTQGPSRFAGLLGFGDHVRVGEDRSVEDFIDTALTEIERRATTRDPPSVVQNPWLLVVFGLDSSPSFDARDGRCSEDTARLREILRRGPGFGVHVMVWVATHQGLVAKLDSRAVTDFDTRIAVAGGRSELVFGIDLAPRILREFRALVYQGAGGAAVQIIQCYDAKRFELLAERAPRPVLHSSPPVASADAELGRCLLSELLEQHEPLWASNTKTGIEAPIGRRLPRPSRPGAFASRAVPRDWHRLRLGDGAVHALVAGRVGAGKSTLLHTLILSLCTKYSPRDLQLYLVDLKAGGVEFAAYRHLPHARVVALDSDREFAIQVLQGIEREMHVRGQDFTRQGVQKLSEYPGLGHPPPRILLIIDEYQVLFESESSHDRISSEAQRLLNHIITQSRNVGIHMMLATQSLTSESSVGLSAKAKNQCALRIALQMNSAADASWVLNKNPEDITTLQRRGEAIYEDLSGTEGNIPISVAYAASDSAYAATREAWLQKLAARMAQPDASTWGNFVPVVYEGNHPADIRDNKPLIQRWKIEEVSPPDQLPLYIGQSLDIAGTHLAFCLRPQAGSNLLICGSNEADAMSVVLAACASFLAYQQPGAAKLHFLNFASLGGKVREQPEVLAKHRANDISFGRTPQEASAFLGRATDELDQRTQSATNGTDGRHSPWLFVLFGLQHLRGLRGYGSAKSTDDKSRLERLLTDGPVHGVHMLLWIDRYSALAATLPVTARECLGTAVALSAVDAPAVVRETGRPIHLKQHQGVLYDDMRPGQHEKFRLYDRSVHDWLLSSETQ